MCPSMGQTRDTRARFGIVFANDGSFGMNCFNCGFNARFNVGSTISAKLVSYLQTIGVPDQDIRELKFTAYREKMEVMSDREPELSVSVRRSWKKSSLPEESRPISEWLLDNCNDPNFISVCQYALERKIYDLHKVYWTPVKTHQMNKRIIIPFYNYNVIVGYSARFYNNTHGKAIPKYFMDSPENFVYNLDEQHEGRQFCILCEGVLDAFQISGIACLGNKINDKQAEVINSLNKKIILCPDRDSSGSATIEAAINYGWLVSFPKWEEHVKDAAQAVNEYGKILTVKTILDGVEHNPLKIHVARKLDNYGG